MDRIAMTFRKAEGVAGSDARSVKKLLRGG